MPLWEYQFGVVVEAEDEDKAWELVRPVAEVLDALDHENDSAVEGPWAWATLLDMDDSADNAE